MRRRHFQYNNHLVDLVQSWQMWLLCYVQSTFITTLLWTVHLGYGMCISIWECISFMGGAFHLWLCSWKREYSIGYSYIFHMLKIARSYQGYDRCFFSYGRCISLCVAAVWVSYDLSLHICLQNGDCTRMDMLVDFGAVFSFNSYFRSNQTAIHHT